MEHIGGQGFVSKFQVYRSGSMDGFNILNIKIYVYVFIIIFLLIMRVWLRFYLNSLSLKHCIEAAGIVGTFLNIL
jgi:hypothetical protein